MSLRSRVIQGGIYLTLRQGLGAIIGAAGMILLTRIIGPESYGLFAAAAGIYLYLSGLSSWGVHIYLIRHEREPQLQDYHQAFTLLLLIGLAGAGLAILLLPLLERWVRLEGFGPVAITMFSALPVNLLGLVPLARLERALTYRKIALIELSEQIAFYAVALPLAYRGLGAWAPVAGIWVQQFLGLSLRYWISGYRPRLHWERSRVRAMLRYGTGYSAAAWIWELRYLVNPLVVGRYAGAEAVGYVALTIRLTEQLGFVTLVASRISTAVLARFQEDLGKFTRAATEGVSLQLMISGPILAGFGLAAAWIFPLFFGPRWLPVLEIYPFIALSYLFSRGINLYGVALQVLRRNWEVAVSDLVNIILLVAAAILLVPQLGYKGYGWAEVVAIPANVLMLIWFRVYVGKVNYAQAGVWFIAWAIPLFTWQLGPWVWASTVVPLLWTATRRELLQAVTMILTRTHRH